MKEYIVQAFDFQETIDLDPFRAEDVPELIRCKDCERKNTTACIIYCIGANPRDDWFCADGVRR